MMDSVLVSYNVFPVHFCLVCQSLLTLFDVFYLTNNSLAEMRGQTSLSCVTDGIRRGYRGDRGSECLGLASGPRLSLVRLGDRLVRALASSTGVVDRGSSVNNWSSMNDRSSVDNGSSVNNRGNADTSNGNRSLGIDSNALIGDLSYVAVDGIGVVVNMLDPAVRKSYGVRTLGIASSVTGLGCIEVRVRVVVSDGVVKCVGGDLVRVGFNGSVSYNRGVVDQRGSVDYRGNSMCNTMPSNKNLRSCSGSCYQTGDGEENLHVDWSEC